LDPLTVSVLILVLVILVVVWLLYGRGRIREELIKAVKNTVDNLNEDFQQDGYEVSNIKVNIFFKTRNFRGGVSAILTKKQREKTV